VRLLAFGAIAAVDRIESGIGARPVSAGRHGGIMGHTIR